MNVESVTYEPVDPETLPGMAMRVIITGSGLEPRAISLAARVGDQAILAMMPTSAVEGVQGFLAHEPNSGDELFIGYFTDKELQATGFKYNPNVA
jgi:hypothetical protein